MRTFLTPDPVTLEIRNTSGEVHLELTDTTTTTVELVAARAGGFGRWDDMVGELFRSLSRGSWDPADRPDSGDTDPVDLARVEYQDTRGTVVVDTDPAQRVGKTAFTIRITAPLASGVRVRTESADVTLTGSASRAEVRTTAGDVILDTVIGPAVVQTSSGSILVRNATAGADLRSASGTLEVEEVRERAQLHTTSGGVIVGNAHDDLSVRSVSGDVRVGSCRSGISDITSVSGAVSIGIDTGVTARLDVTTITGRATAEFELLDSEPLAPESPAASPDTSSDTEETGIDLDKPAGAAERSSLALSVTTTSGDIRVHAA